MTKAVPQIRPRLRTLERMAEVLRAFTPDRTSWKLQELETHLGWDKATTHRFLNALVEIGMLERDNDEGYRIGLMPIELAAVYMSSHPGRIELGTRLEIIAERSGLTTQLTVLSGGDLTVVLSREGARPLRGAAMLGQRLPLHATASGKAVLAQLEPDEVRRLLPRSLPAFTRHTITSREHLESQLDTIRNGELAAAHSEFAEGLSAVAVPLYPGSFGPDPAALGCAGPSPQIASAEWETAQNELEDLKAMILSRRLALGLNNRALA